MASAQTEAWWLWRELTVRERRWVVGLVSVVVMSIALALTLEAVHLRRLFDNVHWTVSYGTAAWLAWMGARHHDDTQRGSRHLLACALSAYAIGQVLWDVQVYTGWNPFPGPSDAFFVCLGPVTAVGLLGFLKGRSNNAQRRLIALDVLGLSIAVLSVTLALYLPRRGELDWFTMSTLVAYPVALCTAASTAWVTMLTLHLSPHRGWLMLTTALLINSALWLQWNSLTLDNALSDGSLYNALFSLAALTQGVGALHLRVDVSRSERWKRACDGLLRLLPLVLVCLVALAIVLTYTVPGVPNIVRWVTWIGGVVVVLVATARQAILINDHANLIAKERALHRAEQVYRVMFEEAADGIMIADARGVVRDATPGAANMLGRTRAELMGLSAADLVAPAHHDRIASSIETVMAGRPVVRDWLFQRKDGSTFPAEVSTKLLPEGHILAMVRDISERQALEAQLRQAQKMEAIGTLAAGIAHDFNNLITAISGNAELAQLDVGPQHPAAMSLGEIRIASTRAAELVRQIVAFSRPRAPVNDVVQPSRMVEEVARLLRSTLPAGVELRVTFDVDAPAVMADASQLHQVLVNLATNAWQAMEGRAGAIVIAVEQEHLLPGNRLSLSAGRYACLSVTDTGSGMDARTRERIFEPFFTTKPVGQGTGLGLAVVHRIVVTHKGAITVDSTPGAGTTFRIYLPAADGGAARDVTTHDAAIARSASNMRVIYVDDEEALVSLIARQLTRAGYHVQTFTSSEAALAAITRAPRSFDVLVTDLNMPKLSGIDLVTAIRALRVEAPFVITSGLVNEDLSARIERLGSHHVLQKPYAFEELQAVLERLNQAAARASTTSTFN